MTLPASVTTNLFPDFKNSMIGPFPRILQEAQDTDNAIQQSIGAGTTDAKIAQSFQVSTAGDAVSINLHLLRVNSPTDNVVIQLCADNAGKPGTVLATGTIIPAASVGAVTPAYYRSGFFFPPALSTSTTYWIVLSRSGSVDSTNRVSWRLNSTNPYANGTRATYNSGSDTWTNQTGDHRFKVNLRVTGRYICAADKTNNKVRMYKSTDGETWTEQDSANAKSIQNTANVKSISAYLNDTFIDVFRLSASTTGTQGRYSMVNDTWLTDVSATSAMGAMNTNVSGVGPLLGSMQPAVPRLVLTWNGATETVMGNARRRVKLNRANWQEAGSFWIWSSTVFDVVGSTNTPNSDLPGGAIDYDLRAMITDGNNDTHVFYTQSDTSNIQHRTFGSDGNFKTINALGSTPAVTSNSAAYSIGQPTSYWKDGDYYIAIPYVDSGVLKVARCKAVDAHTASAWTITSVVTATIETTNSNPASLIADNEQGGKLFLFYTKTDGKLYYTHDQASDSWVPEQELHPGTKTVGALSGGLTIDAAGVVYLDTAPATDDLKFDSL